MNALEQLKAFGAQMEQRQAPRRWEAYEQCSPKDVPADVVWDRQRGAAKGFRLAFGGPRRSRGAEPFTWGAPWRRLINESTRLATFYRYTTDTSR
jgi:hypothetical protein